MAQIFSPVANSIARWALVAAAATPFVLTAIFYVLALSPHVTGQGVTLTQPVPFSHKHHVGGLGLDCRFCHDGVERSSSAGMPATEVCMTCHSEIWTNAAMLEPVRKSLASNTPLRWTRVNQLPDYVYFDHSIHIAKGVGCSTCHGDVATMPLMRQAAPLTMGWCLDCHRDPAKQLRPLDKVFATDWRPPSDQAREGSRLAQAFRLHPDDLTNCSVCHR